MAVEIVRCPLCKQKLGLQDYVAVGALLACANIACGADLRVTSRHPLRVEQVPQKATYSVDYRPESYG
jgi:alpha-aminoadipate/glutamate carrier protein LysW